MIRRNLTPSLLAALADNPVVLLIGPRQAGKTTLVRELVSTRHPARYLTLDDSTVLAAVKADPAGFLSGISGPLILDEIQRAPELFVTIKALVDRDRTPGRFLLTGSANVLLLPSVSESLAGRMEILTLWPMSQGEIEGVQENFIDAAFGKKLLAPAGKSPTPAAILKRVLTGGYPEALARRDDARRGAWFGSYITSILQRDVRDLANIEGLTEMPRLLSLLAARSASLQNFSELSRSSNIPQSTLKRYMALLEATFLLHTVRPWSSNLSHRMVKTPKVMLTDTGLLSRLAGLNAARLNIEGHSKGALLETFVAMEVRKQIAWSGTRPELYHYRTQTGLEADLVLENAAGSVVGLEIKGSSTVKGEDFKGLRSLAMDAGAKFVRGIVLYAGDEAVPFGANLHALPLSALWRMAEVKKAPGAKRRWKNHPLNG